MAIGIGFVNDEYDEISIEDYYEEEFNDAPVGVGFVRDICYERAIERYFEDNGQKEKKMSRSICPSFDDTCPYCKEGFCYMQEMTGDSPLDQCDEWVDDEEEEYE